MQSRAVVLKVVSAKKNQGLTEVYQKLGEKLILQPSNVKNLQRVMQYR